MFYEQDWVMKQIRILVMFVAKVVFGKDTAEYKKLIDEGKKQNQEAKKKQEEDIKKMKDTVTRELREYYKNNGVYYL